MYTLRKPTTNVHISLTFRLSKPMPYVPMVGSESSSPNSLRVGVPSSDSALRFRAFVGAVAALNPTASGLRNERCN